VAFSLELEILTWVKTRTESKMEFWLFSLKLAFSRSSENSRYLHVLIILNQITQTITISYALINSTHQNTIKDQDKQFISKLQQNLASITLNVDQTWQEEKGRFEHQNPQFNLEKSKTQEHGEEWGFNHGQSRNQHPKHKRR